MDFFGICTLKALQDYHFMEANLSGCDTKRVGGVVLCEDIGHGKLQGPQGVSFWNMDYEGFRRIIIPWMQIFEQNTKRVGGVDLFGEIVRGMFGRPEKTVCVCVCVFFS